MALDEATLSEFETKHGTEFVTTLRKLVEQHGDELLVVGTKRGPLVFKKPPQPVWDRWVAAASSDKTDKGAAMRMLCLGSLVHPDQKVGTEIFAVYPALPAKLANALTELSGGGDDIEIKAL